MDNLEVEFHRAMIQTYEDALRKCKYRARAFLQMLSDYGGVATAKRLLATDDAQSGLYELYICGRLDLTVEAKVVRPEFASLFTEEELTEARRRLKERNYAGLIG